MHSTRPAASWPAAETRSDVSVMAIFYTSRAGETTRLTRPCGRGRSAQHRLEARRDRGDVEAALGVGTGRGGGRIPTRWRLEQGLGGTQEPGRVAGRGDQTGTGARDDAGRQIVERDRAQH